MSYSYDDFNLYKLGCDIFYEHSLKFINKNILINKLLYSIAIDNTLNIIEIIIKNEIIF